MSAEAGKTQQPKTMAGRLLLMAGLTFHSGRRLADNPEAVVAIEQEAALAAGTLDEAWAAAEAELPEGWVFSQLVRRPSIGSFPAEDKRWRASVRLDGNDSEPWIGASGPTPAAALLALADALRAVPA